MSELNEAIQEENKNEFKLKNSDQLFIQENYQSMKLEELAVATELPPEVIAEYIENYEIFLKSKGVNPNKKFVFNISMDILGNVSYSLEWPDPYSVDKMLPFVGKLFFKINSGDFKQSMVNFLGRYAEERGAYQIVKKIMEDWNKHQKEHQEEPVISPHEVFGNT